MTCAINLKFCIFNFINPRYLPKNLWFKMKFANNWKSLKLESKTTTKWNFENGRITNPNMKMKMPTTNLQMN